MARLHSTAELFPHFSAEINLNVLKPYTIFGYYFVYFSAIFQQIDMFEMLTTKVRLQSNFLALNHWAFSLKFPGGTDLAQLPSDQG